MKNSKKLLALAITGSVLSHSAFATDWTLAGEDTSGAKTYVNVSELKTNGSIITGKVLVNAKNYLFNHDNHHNYVSFVRDVQIRCQDEAILTVSQKVYDGHMGTGNVVSDVIETKGWITWAGGQHRYAGWFPIRLVCKL